METGYQTSTLPTQEGICVAIRMRPLNERELNGGQHELFKCLPNNSVGQLKDGQPLDGQIYYYDKVFDANTNTATVYEHIGTDIVKSVTSGINGTIFAYGQTSSGKTHTMLGSGDQGGVLEMAAKDIFRQISETSDRDFLLRVSFVEIYNEVIRDLLSDAADPTVAIREDPRKGVYCEANEIIITDYDSIIKALKRGTSKRTVESTAMNDTSSRSHTIFKLVVESKQSIGSDGSVLVASLNLVDLAGSESVRHTGATGQRAKEGGKINQSLLSLSRVIHALSQPGQHVSFRDSKLTRLLQSSLSGNAKMSIVCCITPAEKYLEETRSTLQFASRAKLVKTNATVNEVIDEAVQLRRLKKELEMLKERQGNMVLNDEEYSKLEAEKDALNKQLISLQQEKDRQREQIDRLRELIIAGGDNKGDDDKENESKFRRNKKHRETWCPGAAPLPTVPLTSSSTVPCNNSDATCEVGDISFNSSTSTIVLESSEDASLLKSQLQEALLLIESKNSEIENLKQNLSSAKNDISNDLNQSLDYEPVDLRTRLLEKELRSNIDNLQTMLNEANNKIASLEQELDEANITKELSESDMDICSGNNDNSENIRISELELQLANAAVEFESLNAKISSLEAKNSEGQQLNANLQKMINSMEMEHSITQSELEDSINSLEQNLKAITVARDELLDSKVAAENNLTSLEKEISMIEKMKEVAENDALNASEKVSSLEEEIFTMKKAQESLEEEISSCHDIIVDLEHKNNVANEKIASLEDAITNLKEESNASTSSLSEEEIICMKVQVQELLSEKQEYTENLAQKQARISELESEMSHADELLSEMENDTQVLRNQLHESHNREEELSKAVTDADNEATTYREQIGALEQQLEGAINEMHNSTSQAEVHAKLVEAFNNAQSLNQSLTSELEIMQLKLEEYKRTITSMEDRIRELNEPKVSSEHNSNDMEISIFKGGIALTQETIDNAKRESERLVETMRAKLGEKEAEVSRLMKVNSELQERAVRAEAIISTSIERENSACDSEENLKKRLNQSQTMLDLLKSEKDVVNRKLSECEQELKALSAQASMNEEKLRNQLQQQAEKVSKLQSTHDDNIRLSESNRAIEQHLQEMRLERDDYKNKLDLAVTRIESLEKEFYDVKSKYKDLLTANNLETYNCLNNELDQAKAKVEEVCKVHSIMETDFIELQSRYKKTRDEYSLIQSEWQRCDNELQALLKEKESQSNQQNANASLQSQLEEVIQERDYLNAELDTANTEIESLKEAMEEAMKVQGNEQELLALKQEKSYLSAELEKYVESMELADSKVKSLEAEVEGFKKERDDLNTELDQASQQIQELTDALIEAENLTKHETSSDNMDRVEQIESLKEELSKLQAASELANDRINQLEAKLARTVEERDDLHYQIATLKKDVMNRDDSIAQLRLEISAHTVTTGDGEKDQLLAEMNTLQETNWELENRMNTIESEAKTLREQLSDYDKASAREQELIMKAAESEMSILRTKLQDTESSLSKTKEDIASLTTKCHKFETELLEKEDAIAQAENELYNLQSQLKEKGDDNSNESSSADILKLKEEIEVKDKRIAHLETCKLTKEQMEKIKVLKEERKKFQEDSKIMKKQLHALKKAYDDLKAGATNGDVSAVRDLADARVQLAEVTSQLETAQSVSKSLKDKLRECAKQLQEYETERAGVIDVLERHGIDTLGLVAQDTSLTEGETVIEEELADGVSKLAQKLIASQTNNQQAIASKNKARQLEETIAQMTSEIEEGKSTRSVLEKRLETLKSANRNMREELTAITAERDSLALQVTELESSLKSAEGKIVNSSDTVSSEVQALEEENIELMRENKELRKEASTYRLQAERTLAQLNKVAPDIASSVVGTKRALQEKENTPARPNVSQQQNSEVKKIDSVKKGFTPAFDNDDVNKAKRTRTKAKPLVAAADAGENPGECQQS